MANSAVIDVLLPSRDRAMLLSRSIGSLRRAADDPGQVIVHVGADDDDLPTIEAARLYRADCLAMPRQSYDRLHVYYQQLAYRSTGDWLLVWNDDTVMLTPGWDTVLAGLPPGVLVADLQSHHSPMCCFPAVRRIAVDALGGRFCSNNPHVDTFWQDVGRATGTIAPVPINVRHDQQQGPHWMNQHGYYESAHQVELAECIQLLQARKAQLCGSLTSSAHRATPSRFSLSRWLMTRITLATTR